MKYTESNLIKCLKKANWDAMKYPNMEYRVTLTDEGELGITEWLEHSNSYRAGEKYLFTACYWPGLEGVSPSTEQHVFITERIPELVKEIKRGEAKGN